jgi:hypothetical protein
MGTDVTFNITDPQFSYCNEGKDIRSWLVKELEPGSVS